jgi:hypothetical protein
VHVGVALEGGDEGLGQYVEALAALEATQEGEEPGRERVRRLGAGGQLSDRRPVERVRHHRDAILSELPGAPDAVGQRPARSEQGRAAVRLIALEPPDESAPRVGVSEVQTLDQVGRRGQSRHERHAVATSEPPGLGLPLRRLHHVGPKRHRRLRRAPRRVQALGQRDRDPLMLQPHDADPLVLEDGRWPARHHADVVAASGQCRVTVSV